MDSIIKLGKLINHIPEGYFNIRISQLGRCHRSFQYSLLGVPQEPPPERTKKMWEERNNDEVEIIRLISKKFKKINYVGESKKTFIRPWENFEQKRFKIVFSSTPDGMIFDENLNSWVPLEVKSLNPFRFSSISSQEDLNREYLIQVFGEMILTKSMKAIFVIGNSKSKSDIKMFTVSFDERVIRWIVDRIRHIMKFVSSGKIIYPEFLPGSAKCRWCLYKEKCKSDIYKRHSICYNKSEKIKKDDFEYERIKSLYNNIMNSIEDYNDSIVKLKEYVYEFKSCLLNREIDKIENFQKLSIDLINKIENIKEIGG